MNKIVQSKPTAAKYRDRRLGTDSPDYSKNPRRHLQAEACVRESKIWTEANFPGGSQGKHGEVPSASSGDSYSGRRTSGGGY